MGFRFAIGFQKKGKFGLTPDNLNAVDLRPDILNFNLERVTTDQYGNITVQMIEEI